MKSVYIALIAIASTIAAHAAPPIQRINYVVRQTPAPVAIKAPAIVVTKTTAQTTAPTQNANAKEKADLIAIAVRIDAMGYGRQLTVGLFGDTMSPALKAQYTAEAEDFFDAAEVVREAADKL